MEWNTTFKADVPVPTHALFSSPYIPMYSLFDTQTYKKQIKNLNQCGFNGLGDTVEWLGK